MAAELLKSVVTAPRSLFHTIRQGFIKVGNKDVKNDLAAPAPIFTLPDKVFLLVFDFLDPEHRVLLGLSCKRLLSLLKASHGLSFDNLGAKVRFLHCLENDYPKWLTCNSCGHLYQWKKRKGDAYRCPASDTHQDPSCRWMGDPCLSRYSSLFLIQHINQLFWRAHERGKNYGLPLSIINSKGSSFGISRAPSEVRFVDEQLIVRNRWKGDLKFTNDIVERAVLLEFGFCAHRYTPDMMGDMFPLVEETVLEAIAGIGRLRSAKCPFCAFEYELSAERNGKRDRLEIALTTWRSFGRKHEDTPLSQQMYNGGTSFKMDHEALANRDLRGMFDSGSNESTNRAWNSSSK